jgi:hypothetical protein
MRITGVELNWGVGPGVQRDRAMVSVILGITGVVLICMPVEGRNDDRATVEVMLGAGSGQPGAIPRRA